MQVYVVKMIILILVISISTDHYKVETSHWVPCLIRYRPTLSFRKWAGYFFKLLFETEIVYNPSCIRCNLHPGGKESTLPPIVFIHGLGSSQNFYGAVCELLKKTSVCIRFDTPGSGRSPFPGSVQSVETLTEDVISLFNLLGLENVVLVGHSMGGLVACNVAAREDRVKKLILIGPVHPTPETRNIFENRIRTLKEGICMIVEMADRYEGGMDAIAETIPRSATGSRTTPLARSFIR